MKVLLVKPFNLSDHIQPSLGLGYLASSIRESDDVEIIDCIKERVRPIRFGKILDHKKPDVVGIQCYTYDMTAVKYMLRQCKRRSITTVIGGPHPSAAPLESMDLFGKNLDYLFQGEAEIGFKKLLDRLSGRCDIDYSEMPGLVWREGEEVRINDKGFEFDLDSLGMPAWDLIKPEEYPEAQHGAFFKSFPIAPIIATRGCPFMCTFCAGNLIAGRTLRRRSPQNIIDEITMLYRDHGIREFHIVDDNFTLNRTFAKEFLMKLKRLNLDISWAVPNGVRMDTLDDEILELMKATGLYLISLGIESGSDRVLGLMKKGITTDKIRRSVSLIRKHNIEIAGFFILGFPGETINEINKTIKFALELDLIRANFFTYLPFPGTESFNELKKNGRLDEVSLKKFYFMNATFSPDGITKETLKNLQRKAFLRFFLRPGVLFRNLRQIKSIGHFKYLARRFGRWMFLK
ncbi:MAG: radical SAM protein [Candidatus Omnitrophota bacterium]